MRRLKHGKMSGGCGDSCCLKLEGLNVRIQGEEILGMEHSWKVR